MVSHGYSVLEARDGLEAVDVFSAHRSEVDLVLLDMTMPGQTGADTYFAIRALGPTCRC